MVRLHFIIKTQNGNTICNRAYEVEPEFMIELMGTEENYISYVSEKYVDYVADEYGVENAVAEFIGKEDMSEGELDKTVLTALKAQMILCIDQTGLMPLKEEIANWLEEEYQLGNDALQYMLEMFK